MGGQEHCEGAEMAEYRRKGGSESCTGCTRGGRSSSAEAAATVRDVSVDDLRMIGRSNSNAVIKDTTNEGLSVRVRVRLRVRVRVRVRVRHHQRRAEWWVVVGR